MKKFFDLMMNESQVKFSDAGLNFWADDKKHRTELKKRRWTIIELTRDSFTVCSDYHDILEGVTPEQILLP